jgi:hypothetical protein
MTESNTSAIGTGMGAPRLDYPPTIPETGSRGQIAAEQRGGSPNPRQAAGGRASALRHRRFYRKAEENFSFATVKNNSSPFVSISYK